MSLLDTVSEHLKEAMRAQDKGRTLALRNVRAAFLEAMKVDGAPTLSDEAAMAVLRAQAKRRKESIEAYAAAGRPELADAEAAELAVIEGFLPQLADEDTLRAWIEAAVAATGAAGPKEMGKVMGALNRDHKGEFDGGLASKLVKERLGA